MSKLIESKIVVVTGGAGLLGSAFCKEIINNGGIVIIAENDLNKAVSLKNELNSNHAHAKALDITSENSVNNLITDLHSQFGRIDALVNSAYPRNKNYGKSFFDVTYEDFSENLSLNLGGYFLTSKLFAKYFCNQNHGNIINMSSIYGVIAPKFEIYENTTMTTPVEYAAIKSGLQHLTKYMAKFLKGQNIRVNSIALGGLENSQPESFLKAYKQQCLNKGMLNADDITGTLIYLLSDLSEFVNGQNIIVDDGFTL